MPPDRSPSPQFAAAARCLGLAALAVTALLGAVVTPSAGASERWFTVEIIVFDDLSNDGIHAELWPPTPGTPSMQGAVELAPARESGGLRAFRLVDRSELSLNRVRNSLRRSARYRPLLHAGWRVPGLRRGAARPARLSARLGEGGERPTVQGTVKVSLERYLHVEVDLLYSRPETEATATPDATLTRPTPPIQFRLAAERRMRSRELHYIDHPLFGVLVRITRF